MHRSLIGISCVAAAVPALAIAQTPSRHASATTAHADSVAPAVRPPWLRLDGELRARGEDYSGGGFKPASSNGYVLTRVLLGAHIQATRSLAFYAQGMDARAPWKNPLPAGAPFRDHLDLRQAYVQLGAASGRQQLRVGRIELAFGDGRLVGSLPWANTERTFDGARATFGGVNYHVDAFAASVVQIQQDRFDQSAAGNNFYGVYGSFPRLVPHATIEPFVFWRTQPHLKTELGAPGTMSFGTFGFHAAGKLPSRVDFDAQMATQAGTLGSESIRAWAGHWALGYTFAATRLTPRVFAEYNRASGDANQSDNVKGTFDQLYPTGHDKYGLADLVGWQNMRHVRAGVEVAIRKGWMAGVRHNNYWLDSPHDALYNGGGVVLARSATGAAGSDVGEEWDLITSRMLWKRIGCSAGFARFLPGTFLKNTTPGKPYTYTYVMLTRDF